MSIFTWADGHVSAAHRDPTGKLHGHTWRVRAFWPAGQDAVALQARLRAVLAEFDHAELPEGLIWAEDFAPEIGRRVGAARVDVWREPEGLGATWSES